MSKCAGRRSKLKRLQEETKKFSFERATTSKHTLRGLPSDGSSLSFVLTFDMPPPQPVVFVNV